MRLSLSSILKCLSFILLVTIYQSCSLDKNIPDVSHIQSDVKVQRFEQDLFAIDTNNIASGIQSLEAKYGTFYSEVFLKIISDLRNPDATPEELIGKMVKNEAIRKLHDTCMVIYPNADAINEQLSDAFRYYQYYFPNDSVPTIYSYISEYSLGSFTYEDKYAGFGWDFYLGSDYKGYDPNYFPNYIKARMSKEYIVPKLVEAIANDKIGQQKGDRFIDYIVHNGKVLYLKDLLLPYTPDSIKLEYSTAQTEWVENNEVKMWAHFLREEYLYSTNHRDFRKLIDHSPIAPPGMPQEAPGRAGNWMGWQIIKSFMNRHPDMPIDELLAMDDAQEILEKGRYKPRRRYYRNR